MTKGKFSSVLVVAIIAGSAAMGELAKNAYAQESVSKDEIKITLSQEKKPTAAPGHSKPASFGYTINNNGKDSFATHLYLELEPKGYKLGEDFDTRYAIALAWDRNNQIKKEQNNLEASAKYGIRVRGNKYTPKTKSCGSGDYQWNHFLEGDIGFNRQIEFGDSLKDPPIPNQTIESARITLSYEPYHTCFESVAGKSIYYLFLPKLAIYHDQIMSNVIDPGTGLMEKGHQLGGFASLSIKFAPKKYKRWSLSLTGQLRAPFSAAGTRSDSITGRVAASLMFFLANPPDGGSKEFRPAIGIDFIHGQDPLTGLKKQSILLFALKVGYY